MRRILLLSLSFSEPSLKSPYVVCPRMQAEIGYKVIQTQAVHSAGRYVLGACFSTIVSVW